MAEQITARGGQRTGGIGAGDEPDPRRWKALAVCLIAGFMTLLDVSIVNVALPSIRTGLGASSSDIQLIVAGYALAFGLVLVPSGRIGDARSRRAVFAVGLLVFAIASGFAGAATGPTWLSVARIVQGIGAGILTPQVAGFIQQLFSGPERGKAYGLFGATIGVSTAIGPLLGGVLILAFGQHEGWRFVFYVNLPICVAALLAVRRFLPPGGPAKRAEGLDPFGVLLLAGGTFLLLFPLVHGPEDSLLHRQWWCEGAATALLIAFLGWERLYGKRGGAPVIDLALFKRRSYTMGVSLGTLYFAGFTSIFLVLVLYLQNGLHYSALLSGLTGLPFAIGSAGAAAIGGRVVHRFGRSIVVAGLVLVALGLLAVDLVISRDTSNVGIAVAAPLLVAGVGSGLVISPNQTLTLGQVSAAGSGSGAGVVQTAQRVGSAVGVAAVTAVFFSQVASSHGDFASALSTGLRFAVLFVLLALVVGIADLVMDARAGARRHGRHERV